MLTAIILLVDIAFVRNDIPVETIKQQFTSSNSQYINIDGLNVRYIIEGNGTPIVLIHGTGASLETWNDWTKTLVKDSFQVIRLDIPGFGVTGPRNDRNYSIENYIQVLNDFLVQLNIDSFALAGNSLGGEIAWQYAVAYPNKVTKLILLDPAGFYNDKAKGSLVFKLAKYKWFANIISRFDTKPLVKKTLQDVYYDDAKIQDSTILRYQAMSMRTGNRQAFIDRVSNIDRAKHSNIMDLQIPTLLEWGTEDELLHISLADSFTVNKKVQLLKYDKVGHSPQEEIPLQSVQDAIQFIKY
ncbi:MAG: alpha/beta hydrolase [Chitinophagales bacterium]|nr:alpha/beta hydrolase [Chitinophagales bacterium]